VLAGIHGLSFVKGLILDVDAGFTGITRTERRRTDMRQHGKPLCRCWLGLVQRDVTDDSALLSEPNGDL
jgi:hypothetical protein